MAWDRAAPERGGLVKILIGTYRADWRMMGRCLDSMTNYLADTERWEPVFIDDSGDVDFQRRCAGWGEVYAVGDGKGRNGFATAMVKATEVMQQIGGYVGWWEEDFTVTKRIHLDEIRDAMDPFPNLAQVVLVRQPWFPEEVKAGSMITHLQDRMGRTFERVFDTGFGTQLLMHDMIFSTNPGIWAPLAYQWGWPEVHNSEERKTRYLVEDDNACFAYWGLQETVHHEGERSGTGY